MVADGPQAGVESGAVEQSGPGEESAEGKPAQAHANAVVLADSRGSVEQAAKILGGALAHEHAGTTAVDRVRAMAYLAELSVRLGDTERARTLLDDVEGWSCRNPKGTRSRSCWSRRANCGSTAVVEAVVGAAL
ncbi:hypothetical protein ACFQ0O_04110 [Saccharopolyspora spinosporotrichia]